MCAFSLVIIFIQLLSELLRLFISFHVHLSLSKSTYIKKKKKKKSVKEMLELMVRYVPTTLIYLKRLILTTNIILGNKPNAKWRVHFRFLLLLLYIGDKLGSILSFFFQYTNLKNFHHFCESTDCIKEKK